MKEEAELMSLWRWHCAQCWWSSIQGLNLLWKPELWF